MVVVVAWKFISMAHRKANATRYLARKSEARIQDITNVHLHATTTSGLSWSWTIFMGSALRARQLDLDDALSAAVHAHGHPIGHVDPGIGLLAPGWAGATEHDWLDYLGSCRNLSVTIGEPLRPVDRALYRANGRTGLL